MRILVLANNDIGLYNFRKELLERLIKDGNETYISLPEGDKVKIPDRLCRNNSFLPLYNLFGSLLCTTDTNDSQDIPCPFLCLL